MPKRPNKRKRISPIQTDADWNLFDQTVRQIRKAFADVSSEELKSMIHDAIASVRSEKRRSQSYNPRE